MAVLTTNPYDPALMTQMLGVAPEGLPTPTAAAGGATTPAAPVPMDAEMARRILSGAQVGDMKAAQELYYGADGMGGAYSKTKGTAPDYDPKLDPAATGLATTPAGQTALGGAARPPADMNALMEQSRREATANYARLQQQAQQEAGAGGPGAVDSRYRSLIKDLGDYNAARRPQWLIDNGAGGNPGATSLQATAPQQPQGGYYQPYQQPAGSRPYITQWGQGDFGDFGKASFGQQQSQGWGGQMPQWGGQWGGQSPYQQQARPQQQYGVGQNSQLGYTSWQPQQQQMNYGGRGGAPSQGQGYDLSNTLSGRMQSYKDAGQPIPQSLRDEFAASYDPTPNKPQYAGGTPGFYAPGGQGYNVQYGGGNNGGYGGGMYGGGGRMPQFNPQSMYGGGMMGGQGYSGNTPYINNAMFGRQQGNQQRSW
jgi:hypothetical protein